MKRFDFDTFIEVVALLCSLVITVSFTVLLAVAIWGLTCFLTSQTVGVTEEAPVVEHTTYTTPAVPAALEVYVPELNPPVQEEEIDPELLEQLAIVVYREAGGDRVCDDCRRRVADVALNRVADERFPATLSGVLTQKSQYGTMYWDGIVWPDRAENPGEAHAVDRAYRVAEEVLAGKHSELYGEGYIFQSEFPDLGHSATKCCGIYYAKG